MIALNMKTSSTTNRCHIYIITPHFFLQFFSTDSNPLPPPSLADRSCVHTEYNRYFEPLFGFCTKVFRSSLARCSAALVQRGLPADLVSIAWHLRALDDPQLSRSVAWLKSTFMWEKDFCIMLLIVFHIEKCSPHLQHGLSRSRAQRIGAGRPCATSPIQLACDTLHWSTRQTCRRASGAVAFEWSIRHRCQKRLCKEP